MLPRMPSQTNVIIEREMRMTDFNLAEWRGGGGVAPRAELGLLTLFVYILR